MGTFIRGALVIIGVLLMLAGLGVLVAVPELGWLGFLQLFGSGAFLVVAVAIEKQRYRSDSAERSSDVPGPGGGEPAGKSLDPRFKPTAEVFIDPTSGRQMRVVVDPSTGERRYVAEA